MTNQWLLLYYYCCELPEIACQIRRVYHREYYCTSSTLVVKVSHNHRNVLVFETNNTYSPLQVQYSTIHWLCTWIVLQRQALVALATQQMAQMVTIFNFSPGRWIYSELVLELVVIRVPRSCFLGYVLLCRGGWKWVHNYYMNSMLWLWINKTLYLSKK